MWDLGRARRERRPGGGGAAGGEEGEAREGEEDVGAGKGHVGAAVGPPYLDGDAMVIIGDTRQRLVSYPISQTMREQGRSHINWIAVFPRETVAADETWDNLTDPPL